VFKVVGWSVSHALVHDLNATLEGAFRHWYHAFGVGNQMNDGSIADQRSCPPVLCNEGERAVFDLISTCWFPAENAISAGAGR
jgi:hypothetical protein